MVTVKSCTQAAVVAVANQEFFLIKKGSMIFLNGTGISDKGFLDETDIIIINNGFHQGK